MSAPPAQHGPSRAITRLCFDTKLAQSVNGQHAPMLWATTIMSLTSELLLNIVSKPSDSRENNLPIACPFHRQLPDLAMAKRNRIGIPSILMSAAIGRVGTATLGSCC